MRLRFVALLALASTALFTSAAAASTAAVQHEAKLTGAGETGAGQFGSSIAISADGNTAAVGGSSDNSNVGAVWIFARSGGVWSAQGSKLVANDETGAGAFGTGVALSSDGDTLLVGGEMDNSGTGAAWAFTRSGSTWTQEGSKVTPSDEGNNNGGGRFGAAVALSSDGDLAVIGASRDFTGISNTGAAWKFTRSGSTWTQQGTKFTGSGGTAAFLLFGRSIAVSSDGTTALIGGQADGNGPGAAWVFTQSSGAFTQQGSKLTPSDATGTTSHFGSSVSLTEDGNSALIGGLGDSGNVGAAWAFTRSGSTWTQGSKLVPSDVSGAAQVGGAVKLSSDGTTALIGGSGDASNAGAAWLFRSSGSSWTQLGTKLTAVDETGTSRFGGAVTVSPDGTTGLVGGSADNGNIGAAFPFTIGPPAAPTITPDTLIAEKAQWRSAETQLEVGDKVQAYKLEATGFPAPTYTYVWHFCPAGDGACHNETGDASEANLLTIESSNEGATLLLIATATNSEGSESVTVDFGVIGPKYVVVGPEGGSGDPNQGGGSDDLPADPAAAPAPVTPPMTAPTAPAPPVPSAKKKPAKKKPGGKPATKPGGKPATKPSGKPATKPSGKPATKPATKPGGKPARKPRGKPATKPATKPGSKPATRPGGKPATKPGGKPARRPGGKPATKPATKPGSKPATRPGGKPATKPGGKPARRPGGKPATKPATKPGSKPATRPGGKPATRPGGKPATRPGGKPATKPSGKPARRPGGKPATKPSGKPARRPGGKPATKPGGKPATTTGTTTGRKPK